MKYIHICFHEKIREKISLKKSFAWSMKCSRLLTHSVQKLMYTNKRVFVWGYKSEINLGLVYVCACVPRKTMIKGLRYVRAVVRDYLVNVCARVTAPHNRRENSYKVFPTLTFNDGKTSVQVYARIYHLFFRLHRRSFLFDRGCLSHSRHIKCVRTNVALSLIEIALPVITYIKLFLEN